MCFYPRKSAIKAKVAKSDLIGFKLMKKVVGSTAQSPFQYKLWTTGAEVVAPLVDTLGYKGAEVNEGLHSFKTIAAAQKYPHRENYHVIVPVMVPKGSLYYENQSQIVSNKMIMLGTNLSVFRKLAKKL